MGRLFQGNELTQFIKSKGKIFVENSLSAVKFCLIHVQVCLWVRIVRGDVDCLMTHKKFTNYLEHLVDWQ